jgi:glycosyltransferase involved in cell wall biosynthesis
METIVENPENIESAEVIVGIPSYNEADNIAYPTDVASRGLLEFFPDRKAVIINVDNYSPDGTKEAFLNTPTKVPKLYISTPEGVKGKGNNFRNLFKATVELGAKAIIVVDADLRSITPSWIRYLGEPLMGRFDFVTPIYVRHKYDGTITNHIAYPLLRSLYGLRVRQPIGGDFGFSGKLARAYLTERLWNDKIANFGIDIWMTTIAIARGFNVCQAFLGAPKVHKAKDPPPPLDVSTDALFQSFRTGLEQFGDVWKNILPLPEWSEIEKMAEISDEENIYYHSDLWARILFNFAVAYKSEALDRADLMDALIPFYHSRVLSFVNKTKTFGTLDCEEYLENIIRIFEKEKYYLISRWDETKNSQNGLLFG